MVNELYRLSTQIGEAQGLSKTGYTRAHSVPKQGSTTIFPEASDLEMIIQPDGTFKWKPSPKELTKAPGSLPGYKGLITPQTIYQK